MSFDRLLEKIDQMNCPVVAGLDPDFEALPEYIKSDCLKSCDNGLEAAAQAILTFNKGLIDALYDIVPAVKPQCAYYEKLGFEGMRALYETIRYAKQKGLFVILDGKRNDIGSTMGAYAAAHLGKVKIDNKEYESFGADALTVNGYLGTDGIAPLLDVCKTYDKGIFVLAKTSNPSSGELQDRKIDGEPVSLIMGHMCEKWGEPLRGKYGYSAVGAVVGATYPEELESLRRALPHTFFLVPGYGAQGGGGKGAAPAFDKNGRGAIVNSSRAIMYAYKKEGCGEDDFGGAARREAIRMKNDLNNAISDK